MYLLNVNQSPRPDVGSFRFAPRTKSILLLAALASLLFGAKLLFIARYGSVVPFWDQWDGEAAFLYTPHLDGGLTWSALFSSHNEHRIFFTRILSLGLLHLAGEWDPVLQMVVNAAIHTASIVLLTWLLFRISSPDEHGLLAAVSAVIFSVPVGWENLLAGFQSQFYLLQLFAVGCFSLTVKSSAFSTPWLLGCVLAVCAYFSLASGGFCFFVVAIISGFQLASGERSGLKEWVSIILLVAAGCICIFFVRTVDAHAPLRAHGILQFLLAFVSLAGFPFSASVPSVVLKVFLLPVALFPAILVWFAFLKRRLSTVDLWLPISLLAFIEFQVASISYGRAVGFFAPRYLDVLLMLVPAGFVILSRLVLSPVVRWLWIAGAIGSLVYFTLTVSAPQVLERAGQTDRQMQNVKAFIATSDLAALQNKPFLDIPYPSAERLGSLLMLPQVRAILPAELRPADQPSLEYRNSHLTHPRLYRLINILNSFVLKVGPLLFSLGAAVLLTWTAVPSNRAG